MWFLKSPTKFHEIRQHFRQPFWSWNKNILVKLDRSVPWLLMPWHCMLASYQQPCYWLSRRSGSFSFGEEVPVPSHCWEMIENQICFDVSLNKFSTMDWKFACFSISVTIVGHSRSGTIQKEHGASLLSERSCSSLCLWRHKNILLWKYAWLDWGVWSLPTHTRNATYNCRQ